MRALEGLLNMFQVVSHSFLVKMVNDQALAAGSGTLHFHYTIFNIEGNDLPRVNRRVAMFLFNSRTGNDSLVYDGRCGNVSHQAILPISHDFV